MQRDEKNLVGQRLGKYEIHAEIGRGGMGAVYKGYDPLLDRYLAVKVLAPHLVWETTFVERFLREARAAARLKHPNIVTIYDVGQQENWYYFVMEYVEGVTLDTLIRQHGILPIGDVLEVVKALAAALDYAHGNSLIHRDIKPGNIIVGAGGHITLTDFGIARAADEKRMTSTGTILGTPEYMSPEQAVGAHADTRSDLYSLAVVTYQMLSGEVPYKADSILALLYKVVNEPLPSIRTLRPTLPKTVDKVLQKALAKDPNARYPSVTAFYEALCAAFEGEAPGASLIQHVRAEDLTTSAVHAPAQSADARQQAPIRVESATPRPTPPVPPLPMTPRPRTPLPSGPAIHPPPATPTPEGVAPRRRIPVWGWGIIGALVLIGALVGGGVATGMIGATLPPKETRPPTTMLVAPTATHAPTSTVKPTNTPLPADTPTITPSPQNSPTRAPLKTPTYTPTRAPTDAPTATPLKTATPGVTATPVPTAPPPSPTTNAAAPTTTPQATSAGAFITFEQMGAWRRGDQPYGELTQTQEQVYTGGYAAKLSYDFPGATGDFVVFVQSRTLTGSPNMFSAWVYGDGSNHYVNLWIQDAQNQIWSVHLGRAGSAGWQRMVGTLAPGRPWPDGHVSGTDNGVVDYPVKFYALVLDRPDQGPQKGSIYIDDIAAWRSNDVAIPATTPQAAATPDATTPAVTPAAPVGDIGRIVFTLQAGKTYYLYSTDPNWSHMQEIGLTDETHSTCAGTTATTLSGIAINLQGINKCGITGRTDVCQSPDGRYKVITNEVADLEHTLSVSTADDSEQRFYYQGRLNRTMGIQWSPNSQYVFFGVGGTINVIRPGVDGYQALTGPFDDTWPPQIAPDSSVMYYLQPVGSEGASDIMVVNLDGSELRNLTNAPVAHKLCPRWRR